MDCVVMDEVYKKILIDEAYQANIPPTSANANNLYTSQGLHV